MEDNLPLRAGAWAACKVLGLADGQTDIVLVRWPGVEIRVALQECVGPPPFLDPPDARNPGEERRINPDAQHAARTLWSIVDTAETCVLYLPQPPRDRGFFKSITPGMIHPGEIFVRDSSAAPWRSLNSELVARGTHRLPNRIDRTTQRKYSSCTEAKCKRPKV